VTSVDIYDAQSLYHVGNALTGFGGRGPRWEPLLAAGNQARQDNGMRPAQKILIIAATDPNNDSQAQWKSMLNRLDQRVAVIDMDYRDTSVTLPALKPDDDRPYRPVFSTCPIITYQLGLMASRPGASVMLVTHDFGVAMAALDFDNRAEEGSLLLAGFRGGLDRRFEMQGYVGRPDSPLKFFNLDSASPAILGIPLALPTSASTRSSTRSLFPI
jgi:hypothetical protein